MADGVDDRPELVRASDEHAAQAPWHQAGAAGSHGNARREASPHAQKFRAATALLVGIAIGAVVVALTALASSSGTTSSGKWSSWSPPDSGSAGAREIADHLAPFYRISGVDQLDVVTVVNLANANTAPTTTTSSGSSASSGLQVAVRADPTSSAVSLLSGNTIAYNLCGIGSANCAITVGQASPDRLLLLRREALELALYTFKYIGGTQNVVAILPPGHTSQSCTGICPNPHTSASTKPVNIALLFVRDELSPWLSRPLSSTFSETFPPTVPQLALWKQTEEAGLVEQLTARGLFSEHLSQAQDGSNLIVLDPLPPS